MSALPTGSDLWNIAQANWNTYIQTISNMFGGESNFAEDYGIYLSPPDPTKYLLYENEANIDRVKAYGKKRDDVRTLQTNQAIETDSLRSQHQVDTQEMRSKLPGLGLKSGMVDRNIAKDYGVKSSEVAKKNVDTRSSITNKDINTMWMEELDELLEYMKKHSK